ncbi:MAG TPA: rhomboid family intramembrane serine protease [Cytophagales bacterium]|nr:rhomboid family intramembrane serine protease [Cytophagales bacterium]
MRFELTQVVKILLILNVAVFILDSLTSGQLNFYLALRYVESEQFLPYQFFTYMFAHGSFGHLLGNMFGLFFLGPLLERFLGSKKFLSLYLICGVGAALIHMGVNYWEIYNLKEAIHAYLAAPDADNFYSMIYDKFPGYYNSLESFMEQFQRMPNDPLLLNQSIIEAHNILNKSTEGVPMLGASGAVMGIVATFALLFPNTELFLLFIPFPIKAKYFALMYIGYEIFSIIQDAPDDNVAHFAHLGGMIFAFFLVEYWKRRRDTFY